MSDQIRKVKNPSQLMAGREDKEHRILEDRYEIYAGFVSRIAHEGNVKRTFSKAFRHLVMTKLFDLEDDLRIIVLKVFYDLRDPVH